MDGGEGDPQDLQEAPPRLLGEVEGLCGLEGVRGQGFSVAGQPGFGTLGPALIDRLIDAFDPDNRRAICVPTHQGKRGTPVLWAPRFFAEIQGLEGDVGARHLIGEHSDMVHEVDYGDDAVLIDVDTPEALVKFS